MHFKYRGILVTVLSVFLHPLLYYHPLLNSQKMHLQWDLHCYHFVKEEEALLLFYLLSSVNLQMILYSLNSTKPSIQITC